MTLGTKLTCGNSNFTAAGNLAKKRIFRYRDVAE
jgi:hypothetical protein